MTTLKRYWLPILFTSLGFAISAMAYPHLPQRIPVHWTLDGRVNGWMLKQRGILALPLTALLLLILMIAAEPKAKVARESASGSMARVYPALVAAMAASLLYMTIMIVLIGAGVRLDVQGYVWTGAGILFMVVGNSLSKVTQNFLVGIRTPWTLASEEVWLRTHRVGAWLFVAAGLVTAVAGVAGFGKIVGLAALLAAALLSALYSYVIWRRLGSDRSR
jgi:uncharacterized membrane protein